MDIKEWLKSLTKEERHSLYIVAKEIFIKNIEVEFICQAISRAIKVLYYDRPVKGTISYKNIACCLKEMKRIKPKKVNECVFWPMSDRNVRIKAFDKMIKLTSSK